MIFKDKVILLTGGTGSFGNAFIEMFLHSDLKRIVIFSRDEKKQDDMRRLYKSSKLKFVLGDIRDAARVEEVAKGVDYIFHAAALKQVPSCDFSPLEAVKTNIFGTDNIIKAAIKHKVKNLVCLSTGKAVYPINVMGLTKAVMEKVILQNIRDLAETENPVTKINFIRYSNVFGSRGSAVELFIEQIKNEKPITITHKDMYRSMMTAEEAVRLAIFAMQNGESGDLFIYKAKRTSLLSLAKMMQKLLHAKNHEIQYIGLRHGEKLEETILSEDERLRAEDMGDYIRVRFDRRGLNYYEGAYTNKRVNDIAPEDIYTPAFPTLTENDLRYMLSSVGVNVPHKEESKISETSLA